MLCSCGTCDLLVRVSYPAPCCLLTMSPSIRDGLRGHADGLFPSTTNALLCCILDGGAGMEEGRGISPHFSLPEGHSSLPALGLQLLVCSFICLFIQHLLRVRPVDSGWHRTRVWPLRSSQGRVGRGIAERNTNTSHLRSPRHGCPACSELCLGGWGEPAGQGREAGPWSPGDSPVKAPGG